MHIATIERVVDRTIDLLVGTLRLQLYTRASLICRQWIRSIEEGVVMVTHNVEHSHTRLIGVEGIAHRHTPLGAVAVVIVRYQVAKGDSIARDTLRLPRCSVGLDCWNSLVT